MADVLVLGIISALVAGNIDAVSDMLATLAREDAKRADEVIQAIARGNAARKSTRPGT